MTLTHNSASSSRVDWGNFYQSSNNTNTIQTNAATAILNSNASSSGSQPCNESKIHSNEEKALFHGMKSAFRMSRQSDGEYGTEDAPPWKSGARIALNVARSFFETTEFEYTPEESEEYLEQQIISEIEDVIGIKESEINHQAAEGGLDYAKARAFQRSVLGTAIEKAWNQINKKQNHYDGARTAMAAAQWFLDKVEV